MSFNFVIPDRNRGGNPNKIAVGFSVKPNTMMAIKIPPMYLERFKLKIGDKVTVGFGVGNMKGLCAVKKAVVGFKITWYSSITSLTGVIHCSKFDEDNYIVPIERQSMQECSWIIDRDILIFKLPPWFLYREESNIHLLQILQKKGS